jgi:Tol biopolymer transport system component
MDDIWIAAPGGTGPRRLTANAASDNSPVWTHDGLGLVFRSNRTGVYNLHRADLASGADRPLLRSHVDDQPTDASRSGDLLLFNRWSMDTREDIWALPLGGGSAYPVLRTEFLEGHAVFSPDGQWIAYETNASGAAQVHVRRFHPPARGADQGQAGDGTTLQLSVNGGYKPRWTADGRTVVYVRDDHRFEAVDLDLSRAPVTAASPRALFITRPRLAELGGYDIDPSGRRILAPTPGTTGTPEPSITRMRGWTRALGSMPGRSR